MKVESGEKGREAVGMGSEAREIVREEPEIVREAVDLARATLELVHAALGNTRAARKIGCEAVAIVAAAVGKDGAMVELTGEAASASVADGVSATGAGSAAWLTMPQAKAGKALPCPL